MKKFFAVILAFSILVSCTLTGCSDAYKDGEWKCIYSTIDNSLYSDDLDYKFTLSVLEEYLFIMKGMRYRIEIFESDNLEVPCRTYISDSLIGVAGVDLKHTMVKDPGKEAIYEKYLTVLAAENCILVMEEMQQEIKENGYDSALGKRLQDMSNIGFESLEEACGEYSGNMAEDVYKATLFSLSGALLDSTTQFVDDITSSLFGQNNNLNLFTTKTVGFLEDLGVYVDEDDVDITLGISKAAIIFPQKLHEITQLAFASEEMLANASIASFQEQSTTARLELINYVLEHCEEYCDE